MNKTMSVLNIVLVILLLYLIITISVYFFQRKLLYHPSAPPNFNQQTTGLGLNHKFEKIKIEVEKQTYPISLQFGPLKRTDFKNL